MPLKLAPPRLPPKIRKFESGVENPIDVIPVDAIPVDAVLVDIVDAMPIPIDDIPVDAIPENDLGVMSWTKIRGVTIPIDDNVDVDVDVENLNDNEDDN
ncbi:hypothetical protein MTR_2g094740 [Medicago truncatula]|uniref:Uncharacterized protein n=1 Tax=Medicago truncatula TaxID=3880 RepID=A0A072VMI7_MEDTR|nr:hypothetical protein MTR_2g094740 [Medicago truncatula]